ncbi:MAG: hypothetical protein KDD75_06145 [Caldilineaceae bacterium]|nr:hypothetical protein [Caldilineaceae bacterium]
MANTALTKNTGRQYPLVLVQDITFANVADSGVSVVLAKLPRDAIVLSGSLLVTTAFTAGTLSIGYAAAAAAHGAIDATTTGVKALTVTGLSYDDTELLIKPSAAQTAGAARLFLTYVMPARANEAQP